MKKVKSAILVDAYGNYEIWIRANSRKNIYWITCATKTAAIRECAMFQKALMLH